METGRAAELAELIKETSPVALEIAGWQIVGHLTAGRPEEALKYIDDVPAEQRTDLFSLVIELVELWPARGGNGRTTAVVDRRFSEHCLAQSQDR